MISKILIDQLLS